MVLATCSMRGTTSGSRTREFVSSLYGGELESRLTSLVLKDFWPQAFQRRSKINASASFYHCKKLHNLEVKNASLHVKGLKPMLMLRRLSFEFVKLDDEDLDKINKSFPFLEVLKFFQVVGLNNPKIRSEL